MRTIFEKQLREVRANILELGRLAERSIAQAVKALTGHDLTLAQAVVSGDADINRLRFVIEEEITLIIATQQPTARDLRELVTALAITSELERIADHAKGIGRLVGRLDALPTPPDLAGIPEMAEDVRRMLRDSLDAYAEQAVDQAEKVAQEDYEIDKRYQSIFETLGDFMDAGRPERMGGTYLLWVSHNLERVGDRATNIAERVIFAATGRIVELNQD
ncbi:MAG: phosphate signaling complex protein PhoU [Anaerolineae bacterium]